MSRFIHLIGYLLISVIIKCHGWSSINLNRRDVLSKAGYTVAVTLTPTRISNAQDVFTTAYGKEEYTNSITASRDTNISPKEVYDSIQSFYVKYPLEQLKSKGMTREARAWDVGAGAGVSTQTLYNMGYTNIEAVDWSDTAVSNIRT
jgi:2-polyprenyl-3-methyl-5-hydroxy-6-metoxy-1,4-benzoquinol methylase